MRTLEARGLSGSTGAPSGDTKGTRQGRDEAARNTDGRRSPSAESSGADLGSGVRGRFSGMLVWISAVMQIRRSSPKFHERRRLETVLRDPRSARSVGKVELPVRTHVVQLAI